MTKKRKVEYRKLTTEAEAVPQPETAAAPETAAVPEAAAEPEVAVEAEAGAPPQSSPRTRPPSLTPRQLAAVLNEPRRTPAMGVPVVSIAPAPTVSPTAAPTQIAAALTQAHVQPEAPEPELTEVLLFHVGHERFAASLAAIDEAVDLPVVHTIPESPPNLLGVFELRGRLVPLYSPRRALRLPEGDGAAPCAFIISTGTLRIGIAVDGLDDAVTLPSEALREAPDSEDGDGVLLGVAHVGRGVVTVVSARALARSCLEAATVRRDESSAATEAA